MPLVIVCLFVRSASVLECSLRSTSECTTVALIQISHEPRNIFIFAAVKAEMYCQTLHPRLATVFLLLRQMLPMDPLHLNLLSSFSNPHRLQSAPWLMHSKPNTLLPHGPLDLPGRCVILY